MTQRLGEVLSRLYDSEINCGLRSFWDAGWQAWLGDEMNGHDAERSEIDTPDQVAAWLHENAIRLYPNSEYARRYGQ